MLKIDDKIIYMYNIYLYYYDIGNVLTDATVGHIAPYRSGPWSIALPAPTP